MDKKPQNWFRKHWIISIFLGLFALGIIGSLFDSGDNSDITGNVVNEQIKQTPEEIKTCTPNWNCDSWSECSSSSKQTRTCSDRNNCNTLTDKPKESQSCSPPPVEETLDTATIGEKNALDTALSYLSIMPFSYSGLIEQLEYEGYTYQEAVYGVDNCGADWNEQAALQAQSYLDIMPFSREGLIEQLEFEGFTKEQAEYGVQDVGY